MVKKVLLGLGAIIAVFLIYVACQPAEYNIAREVAMNASPEVIFPYINDAKKMESWSPWMDMDPEAKMHFSGPTEGVGACTSWEGGKKLGTGKATVTESVINTSVTTKLEYTKPSHMTQEAEIRLIPSGPQTIVRWSVKGSNKFTCRVFCTFMNMDKMVGGTFEQGLNKLKGIVEKK